MIRHATAADLDAIVAMGERFLATVYGGRLPAPPDPVRMRAFAASLLEDDATRALLVAEHDGALTGMFGLHIDEHPLTGQVVAHECFWWVAEDRRGRLDAMRLLAAARSWATAAGAAVLFMVAPNPRVEQLYTRLHYTPLETTYVATL